jgi:hypothetical protein
MLRAILETVRKRKWKLPYLANKGVKVRITKIIGIEIQFLRVKKYHHVIFVDEKDTQRLHAELEIKQWPLQRKTAEWGKYKAEKAQTFAAAASSTQKEDSSSDDEEKKDFMKSFMASWKTSQKDKKAQKNKRKHNDNDTSDSEQAYSKSSKLVALKPKRIKIGIPTTEVIGETTVNGSKKPLCILIDTGSSSLIILKKFINKSLLVKNSRTTTEWTTLVENSSRRNKVH